jgi:uncharacterized protein (TIGR02996 family)
MSAADRAAFLRAIAENPDDDLPRLVYADWLDEHGEPARAEFIRVQCELDRLPRQSRVYDQLVTRYGALLLAHDVEWRPPRRVDITYGMLERGFVWGMGAWDFAAFADVAESVFAEHPIQHVQISQMRPQHLRTLAQMPLLARLTDLDVSGGTISNAAVSAFARSPYLCRLRTLNLSRHRIGDVGAQALAESPGLANLRELALAGNQIGDVGAEALAAAPHWHQLTHLVLRTNRFSRDALALLRARYGDAVKL